MHKTILLIALTASLGIGSLAQAAGPVTVITSKVTPTRRFPLDQLPHGTWNYLVRKYVDQQGMVDYASWKKSAEDQERLLDYLRLLTWADLNIAATKEGRLAFWINAYNALTIHGILKEYPTSSIRNHTARVFGYNIWKDLQLSINGRTFSLHAIEHDILRKMKEPRIHFAIVCASISCPKLLNRAYTRKNVEELLDANTKSFFANPSNFRLDTTRGKVHLSSIMKWFAKDFGANSKDQLIWVSKQLTDKTAQKALASGDLSITYLSYDWGLNEQQTRAASRATDPGR